jgi:hypothetical protein
MVMRIIGYFNERVKRFTIFDIKLVQCVAIFVILILVKLIPEIISISIWWFVALLVISVLRPAYVLFVKQ